MHNNVLVNRSAYEIMVKCLIHRMQFLCWITKATGKQTSVTCNTYCFSTATIVSPTRLNITFIPTLLVLSTLTLLIFWIFHLYMTAYT
jgi:hypothetical protein